MSFIFTLLLLGQSAFALPSIKAYCEGLLYSSKLEQVRMSPAPTSAKVASWIHLTSQMIVSSLVNNPRELQRRQNLINGTQDRWLPIFTDELKAQSIYLSHSFNNGLDDGFELDRVGLVRKWPHLEPLLPKDYHLVYNPFLLAKIDGIGYAFTHGDKQVLGLPKGIVLQNLSANEQYNLVHENVHIQLDQSRRLHGTDRFKYFFVSSGRLRDYLRPYFSGYADSFNAEEVFANLVTSAAQLDKICLGESQDSEQNDLVERLDFVRSMAQGFVDILQPLIRESLPFGLKQGVLPGGGIVWNLARPDLYIVDFYPHQEVSADEVKNRVALELDYLNEVLSKTLKFIKPVVLMAKIFRTEPRETFRSRLCMVRRDLWSFIGSVDPALVQLKNSVR